MLFFRYDSSPLKKSNTVSLVNNAIRETTPAIAVTIKVVLTKYIFVELSTVANVSS